MTNRLDGEIIAQKFAVASLFLLNLKAKLLGFPSFPKQRAGCSEVEALCSELAPVETLRVEQLFGFAAD
ncbi:hypothetical protein CUMW_014840 [Citrus unshiu]|nr:hypothetical protein CUMW_014840 [Citrus unshiu]